MPSCRVPNISQEDGCDQSAMGVWAASICQHRACLLKAQHRAPQLGLQGTHNWHTRQRQAWVLREQHHTEAHAFLHTPGQILASFQAVPCRWVCSNSLNSYRHGCSNSSRTCWDHAATLKAMARTGSSVRRELYKRRCSAVDAGLQQMFQDVVYRPYRVRRERAQSTTWCRCSHHLMDQPSAAGRQGASQSRVQRSVGKR